MNQNNFNSIFPIVEYGFPIQRSFKSDGEKVSFYYPEYAFTRSQDLEKCYHDAGQFYFMNIQKCLDENKIITSNSGYISINRMESQDIDDLTDWKLAELKYEMLQSS